MQGFGRYPENRIELGFELAEHADELPEKLEIQGYIERNAHSPYHQQVENKRGHRRPKQVLFRKEKGGTVAKQAGGGRHLENGVDLLYDLALVLQ